MMAKNWSKGTHPLDSEQQHIATTPAESSQHGDTSSVSEVVESIKDAASGDEESRRFLLRVVQPGLAGLMDGSVSTLAPIFATAFATHRPFTAFLIGMAAATGAGISMAFSEALSDNGELTGRGSPVLRGLITGGMTFLGGSLHTLPFLVQNLHVALLIAYVVVAVELVAIAVIRYRFFGTKWWLSMVQVVGGGALVFTAALIFGNA
jgi:erythrin-vacuolar iron transport family protein